MFSFFITAGIITALLAVVDNSAADVVAILANPSFGYSKGLQVCQAASLGQQYCSYSPACQGLMAVLFQVCRFRFHPVLSPNDLPIEGMWGKVVFDA